MKRKENPWKINVYEYKNNSDNLGKIGAVISKTHLVGCFQL